MADLFSLLGNASRSLSAHRAASQTASNNLQNVNTLGYSRQRAELSAVLPSERVGGAMLGQGAMLTGVTQARDRFLEAQVPASLGNAARYRAQADAVSSLAALNLEQPGGPAQSLNAFFGAMRVLSQNPSDLGLRQAAVNAAQGVGIAFNSASQQMSSARSAVDDRLGGDVDTINQLAARMADLNRQVRQARADGASPNDLLDARQRVQDQLIELTGATPVPSANGDVSLALGGGTALVTGDQAASLGLLANASNNGLLDVRVTPAGGGTPRTAGFNVLGGSVGGLLEARDGTLKKALDELDTLAFDFASAVNAAHQPGVALDGSSGADLFAAGASSAGAAGRLSVNTAITGDVKLLQASESAGSLPGNNKALLNLLGVADQALSSGRTVLTGIAQLTSSFGANVASAQGLADHHASLKAHVEMLRESTSGVSIDEEMVHLSRAQRAFEAVSKVIQVTDEMLDTLMKLK